MPETLGSLCDKLTIVKLKQFHCDDAAKGASLSVQERQLAQEIDGFLHDAMRGMIPPERLTFGANKVYRQEGNELASLGTASVGGLFAELAKANCDLWHVQEKVYEFETVPPDQKDQVVKQLALLNLRRTRCVDEIDRAFWSALKTRTESTKA